MLGATLLLVHRPRRTTLAPYDGCLPVNYLTTLPLVVLLMWILVMGILLINVCCKVIVVSMLTRYMFEKTVDIPIITMPDSHVHVPRPLPLELSAEGWKRFNLNGKTI